MGVAAAVLLGCLGLAIWTPQLLPLERILTAISPLDADVQEGLIRPNARELHVALRRNEFAAVILVLLSVGLYYLRAAAVRALSRKSVFDTAFWAACTAAVSVALVSYGHEGAFSPVTALMQRPLDYPITGNRMLLVWLADLLKWLFPALSDLRCYLLTQVIAAGAAMYMMGRWCALLLGERYRIPGQAALAAALIPTIIYYTFYDIAMVFFYTLCLMLLYQRRHLLFVLALGAGTMNHENTLLLAFVSAVVLFGKAPRLTAWLIPASALAMWVAVRLVMQHFFPIHGHFEVHIWTNFLDVAELSRALVKSAAILIFWWLAAAVALEHADQFLRRAFILLPSLMLVTFLAGKFIEARQWDAFLPVGIPLILSGAAYFNQSCHDFGARPIAIQ